MNPLMVVAIIGLITCYRWHIQDSNKIPSILLFTFSAFLLGWVIWVGGVVQ